MMTETLTKSKKESEINIGSFKFFNDVLFKVLNLSSMLNRRHKSHKKCLGHLFSLFLKVQRKYMFSKICIVFVTFPEIGYNES